MSRQSSVVSWKLYDVFVRIGRDDPLQQSRCFLLLLRLNSTTMASTNRSPSNGSQPPAYDAALALTSVAPVQQYSQQPVMMVPAPPVSTPPVLGMQNPNYDGPEDFLVLIIITTTVCAFLNLTSLVFGIIAIVMAIMAITKKGTYDYPGSQRYSMMGVVLAICTIVWTGITTTVIIGSITGVICQRNNYNYYGYYYYSYYYSACG
ncbi:hypothetical protein EMCRGX_G018709 [Ephydatia muelleri]